jgi:rare lipoprotein A
VKKLIISLTILFMLPLTVLAESATYYSNRFNGRKMANGKVYHPKKMIAAHNRYPLGTRLKVVNKTNGKSVSVVVSDRCSCSIDLSPAAFKRISNLSRGRVAVKVLTSG